MVVKAYSNQLMKYKTLAILCILVILCFTILPVEANWAETDILLTKVICGMVIVAVVMCISRGQQIMLSAADFWVILWLIYVMLRAYVPPIYPCANFCLRAMQMFSLYIAARLLFTSAAVSERVLVFGILLCAGYEVLLGMAQLWNGNSRHYLYALSGTFLNPGPYSAFLAMGFVMSCKLQKGCWLPVLFAILLPATWSRAAIVSAAICLGIIYWNKWKRWKLLVAFVIPVIIVGLYFMKKGSADGRSIIYMISFLNILQHPLFGSGIGSFCHQYAEGIANFSSQHPAFDFHSADVTSSAYNIFLQIGVEQGAIGLSLATGLMVLIFNQLRNKGKSLGIGLLCLLIFSMFSYPFELLPYQVIFVLIAAYAATGKADCTKQARWRVYYRSYLAPIALSSVVFLFSIFTHTQMKERMEAESDYQLMAGVSHAAFIDDYYKLLPLLNTNEHFLFEFAKVLADNSRYNDSNAMLRMGTLVSCDPMFYIIQGNNYRDMGFFPYAERAYKRAFAMMPNRLYPLYKLMFLYEQWGQKDLMEQMAQRVAYYKEKVTSPATRDMKKKAWNIIYDNNKQK